MNHTNLFRQLENGRHDLPLAEIVAALNFNADGLLPVVVQCRRSRAVLMLAWMNPEALRQTLAGGEMVYFSRRRQALWRKGETSGCTQTVHALFADCDGDTLLAEVEQIGAACHSNRPSCFYIAFCGERAVVGE